jgi:lipopolysaccharide export system permease protein
MKILDKYIIKKFLGTFFFALLLIIAIVIVFDISEKIDDFLEKKAPLSAIVFDYYLNFIPYFVNLFSPLFTFIAVIFFTAKLATDTEIVAMLSGGISFRRLMVPYMMAATVLSILSFVLGGWIIPNANKSRLAFENRYIKNPYKNEGHNIHIQIRPGTFIYMESFNTLDNTGYKYSMEKVKDGKITFKLMTDYVRWDTVIHKWELNNYFIREIKGMKETLRTGLRKDTALGFTSSEFNKRINTIETMNNRELTAYINQEKMRGSGNLGFYYIEKYKRIASPLSTYILTLIGMALASRKVRGGIGLQLGIGISLSFTYILFMQVSQTFATNSGFSPLLAVWIPNIFFSCIALYLLRSAPK